MPRLTAADKAYLKLGVECLETGMTYLRAAQWREPALIDVVRIIGEIKDLLSEDDPLDIRNPAVVGVHHLGDSFDGVEYWAHWDVKDGPVYRLELRNPDERIGIPLSIADGLYRHLHTHRGWMLANIHARNR